MMGTRGTSSAVTALAACAAALALAGCALLAPGLAVASTASSSITFTGRFNPDKLGAQTTMELGFQIHRPNGEVPPPLVGMEFLLPAGVSLTSSELGLDTCTPETLANMGAQGCLPDAVMGYGKAVIAAPDAAETLFEPVDLTVLMAPPVDRHTTLVFYASGTSPVIAQEVFSSAMLEGGAPFGVDISTTIPLTAGLPGEPDSTVVRMQSSIGPKGVTYYKNVHGTRVPYSPQGVILPLRCPAGGFPFAATFVFADGSRESAQTTSPCPAGGGHGGHSSRGPRRRK